MRFCSIFCQLLQLFPEPAFQQAVQDTKAQRHAHGFKCWDQFVAMLFCQLAQVNSLREVCGGLAACQGKLVHLGLHQAPAHSTLAYAHEHRSYQLYEQVFHQLLARCQVDLQARGALRPHPKVQLRFKNPLLSLHASLIELCVQVFDWAKFGRTKGAAKLHLMLNHRGYWPAYAVITQGAQHEITVARTHGGTHALL
jgi:hypothetical protein